uniref:Uncharacterized protein n=1 Tax=Brassica oleracea var. oleracea TaxID=109376 RepID=A0A0D3BL13_BRAOL
MVRNPTLYGLAPDALVKDVVLEERRADLRAFVLSTVKLICYACLVSEVSPQSSIFSTVLSSALACIRAIYC